MAGLAAGRARAIAFGRHYFEGLHHAGYSWKRKNTSAMKLAGPMPKALTVTLANLTYFERAELP